MIGLKNSHKTWYLTQPYIMSVLCLLPTHTLYINKSFHDIKELYLELVYNDIEDLYINQLTI